MTELRVLAATWAPLLAHPFAAASLPRPSQLRLHKLTLTVDTFMLAYMAANTPGLGLAVLDCSLPAVRRHAERWQSPELLVRPGAPRGEIREVLEQHGTGGIDCFSSFLWDYCADFSEQQQAAGGLKGEGTATLCLPVGWLTGCSGRDVRVLMFRTDNWTPVMRAQPLVDVSVTVVESELY